LLRSFEPLGFSGTVAGWTVVAGCVVLPAALVAGFQFPLPLALLASGGALAGADSRRALRGEHVRRDRRARWRRASG
jgi:hypothetical protein